MITDEPSVNAALALTGCASLQKSGNLSEPLSLPHRHRGDSEATGRQVCGTKRNGVQQAGSTAPGRLSALTAQQRYPAAFVPWPEVLGRDGGVTTGSPDSGKANTEARGSWA